MLPQPLPQPVIDLLATEGITVLAPTNQAIDALPTWNDILADETALQHFVLAHVVPGQLDEGEIFAMAQVTALSGDVLTIDPVTQTINGAHLVVLDQLGTNGMAHSVDAVLVVPPVTPPTTEAPPPPAASTSRHRPPPRPRSQPHPDATPRRNHPLAPIRVFRLIRVPRARHVPHETLRWSAEIGVSGRDTGTVSSSATCVDVVHVRSR